jgi:hypothetical protein
MLIRYQTKRFTAKSLKTISMANQIIEEFTKLGYTLTLRQLFYQFVARDLIPNTHRSYKNLGELVSNARLNGNISWKAIEDRTRPLRGIDFWEDPSAFLNDVTGQYTFDLWKNQPCRIEVLVEKDALVDVVARACNKYQVDFSSCRGYFSQTATWKASQRYDSYNREGKEVIVVHLADHDPSGINMTEDLTNRLRVIFEANCRVHRIALNMDQIEEYKPPPNYAKITDSRYKSYVERYGEDSWELDAIRPNILGKMIEDKFKKHMNVAQFNRDVAIRDHQLKQLKGLASKFKETKPRRKK